MREVKYEVYHVDCWGPRFSEHFPEALTTLKSSVAYLDHSGDDVTYSCLWEISAADAEQLNRSLAFLDSDPSIKELVLMNKEKARAIVQLTARSKGCNFETIIKNKSFLVSPMDIANGMERWHVVTESPTHVKNLLNEASELGEVKVTKIGKYQPQKNAFNLTNRQRQALEIARFNGYYKWPRRTTLEELSALMSVSRRTFQDHLRKAEAKAFPPLLEQVF